MTDGEKTAVTIAYTIGQSIRGWMWLIKEAMIMYILWQVIGILGKYTVIK